MTYKIDISKVKQLFLEREKAAYDRRESIRKEVLESLCGMKNIFGKYNINRAYLYGSMVSGNIRYDSDVDIAIEGNVGFKQILSLYSELSKMLDRNVDVRMLNELSFAEAIKEKGILVYERKTSCPEK